MKNGKIVLGTLAGLAIGATAGILFAPKKGAKTRKLILDKGEDYVNELKSKVEEIFDSFTKKIQSTKKDANQLVDKGKEKYDDVKKDVKKAMESFKHEEVSDIKHVKS